MNFEWGSLPTELAEHLDRELVNPRRPGKGALPDPEPPPSIQNSRFKISVPVRQSEIPPFLQVLVTDGRKAFDGDCVVEDAEPDTVGAAVALRDPSAQASKLVGKFGIHIR